MLISNHIISIKILSLCLTNGGPNADSPACTYYYIITKLYEMLS